MPAPSLATILVPDRLLAGSGANMLLTSYTNADGMVADVGVPDALNEGGLMVTQSGAPTAKTPVSYRVIASGGIWGEATWGNLLTNTQAVTDALPSWRGENDPRYMWATHWPFVSSGAGTGRCKAVAWVPGSEREICYHLDADYVWVAYRTVSRQQHQYADTLSASGDWLIGRCTRTDRTGFMASVSDSSAAFGVETMRDGKLVMLRGDDSNADLEVFVSEDGIDWTPVADNILARFSLYGISNSADTITGFRSAVSGDYICFSFVWYDGDDIGGAGAVHYVRTMVSSDRGASWVETTTLVDEARPYELGSNIWKWRYDIAGVDDDAGTFMIFIGKGGASASRITTLVGYRSGMDSWTFDSSLQWVYGAANEPFGVWAARGPQWIYVYQVNWDSAASEWDIDGYFIDPRNYAKTSGWRTMAGGLLRGKGTYNYMLHNMRFANIGGMYLACHASLIDADADKSTPNWFFPSEGDAYFRVSGWDNMPFEERDHPKYKDEGIPYRHTPGVLRSETGTAPAWNVGIIEWNAWSGAPDPGHAHAAANTPWTNPLTGNVTTTWSNANTYKITDTSAGASRHEIQYLDSTPDYTWMGQTFTTDGPSSHMLEVIIKVNEEALGIHTSAPRVGVKVWGYDHVRGGSTQHKYELHFSETQAGLWDDIASAWIVSPVTVTGIGTNFIKFRVGALSQPWKGGDPVDVAMWARNEETDDAAWVLLGSGRLQAGAGSTQKIVWGHLNGQTATRESEWRRVAIYGAHDGGATRGIADAWGDLTGGPGTDDKFYDNLRGRSATHDSVYIYDGVSARWGGGGGFEGDEYTAKVVETFGPENILMIGSPRTQYRSEIPPSGTIPATLTYDALGADSKTMDRFHHQGFSVFGYSSEELVVEYDDVDTFSSPVATHTLSLHKWTGRVLDGNGNMLEVDFGESGPEIGEEMSGQGTLAYYLRFTLGTTDQDLQDIAFKVISAGESQIGATAARSVRLDAEVDVSGVAAGASFTIFSDRGAMVYNQPVVARYMRLTMANTGTAYSNQHRLGHFTAGQTLTLAVPLEWNFTDAENPNTTEFKTEGVKRWAFENGPAQRVLQSRMVGDIEELRQKIRRYLRVFTRYDMYPMTVLLDDQQLKDPERVFLGCVKSGAQFSEYGQRYDSTRSRWVTVGDMKLKWYEEV